MSEHKEQNTRSPRLASLDALRGFDMFWIMGGDHLVHVAALGSGWAWLAVASGQLKHAVWTGVHVYDLVFPLFMFLSGVSLTLSMEQGRMASDGKTAAIGRAARRAAILVVLGIIYNFGWSLDPAKFRVAIAAAVLVLLDRWLWRAVALAAILLTVATLQLWIPVPGHGAGVLTPVGIVNGWIDRAFLPGRLYGGSYDPEGILSTFSGAAVTLSGAFAGALLLQSPSSAARTPILLAFAGTASIAVGALIAPYYPPIKAVWTVTFDLLAAGASMLLFAFFLYVIDVMRWRRWSFFFVVIGVNSIAIYMTARFVAYPLFAMIKDLAVAPALAILLIAAVTGLHWLALWALYRKKLFLRV
jgi:predicted acyltransferase